MLVVYAVPAALQAFVRPNLEKYFISNADVSLISACSSMGELMIIVVSAAFCTKKQENGLTSYSTSSCSFQRLYRSQ